MILDFDAHWRKREFEALRAEVKAGSIPDWEAAIRAAFLPKSPPKRDR